MCYEVLPFVFDDKLGRCDSLVIVVSPLISRVVDQVQSLRRRSVKAAILSQSESKVDKELLVTNVLREAIFCHYGDIQQVCNPTWKILADCCLAKQTNS